MDAPNSICCGSGFSSADGGSPKCRKSQIRAAIDNRDYGELVFRYGHPAPSGIVFFRFAPATIDEPAPQLLALMADDQILLDGMFTVVDRQHIRQRPLTPPTPAPES
jgi:hypothetical protein